MTELIELAQAMNRSTKVLLVMDVVESVRLMELDADDFVRRWQKLVQEAEKILSLHGGRIVKSLGDGLMLEFADAPGCMKAAFALQDFSRHENLGLAPESQLHLRMGGHLASFVKDQYDIYGTDVNLTARIATLAGPEQIVISAGVVDKITDGLDADIEDLGDCYLKHVKEPVRTYCVRPLGNSAIRIPNHTAPPDFRPTIAVIPFSARSNEPEHFVVGEVIADGIIAQLSRSPDIRVISRLSTTAFRGRSNVIGDAQSKLDAAFVLSGSYLVSGAKVVLMAELTDAKTDEIVWANRLSGDLMSLLENNSELLDEIANATSRALIDTQVMQSLIQPLPRLDSCALMLGGIASMHRSSRVDFDRSRQALEVLTERHSRIAAPRAWMAKWYIMRVVRGMSDSPEEDTKRAMEHTARALDMEPNSALARAIRGHALCHLSAQTQEALQNIDEAIRLSPNESLAWLYRSVWTYMWGTPAASVGEANRAAQLSPLDPMRYYYDSILAAAYSMSGDFNKAMEASTRSLKANRHHQPTIRTLLHAQVNLGKLDDARNTLVRLFSEDPDFTVSSYLSIGNANSASRQEVAIALRKLGVPER